MLNRSRFQERLLKLLGVAFGLPAFFLLAYSILFAKKRIGYSAETYNTMGVLIGCLFIGLLLFTSMVLWYSDKNQRTH